MLGRKTVEFPEVLRQTDPEQPTAFGEGAQTHEMGPVFSQATEELTSQLQVPQNVPHRLELGRAVLGPRLEHAADPVCGQGWCDEWFRHDPSILPITGDGKSRARAYPVPGSVPSILQMIPSMISSAPAPIDSSRQSRNSRATGDSHM